MSLRKILLESVAAMAITKPTPKQDSGIDAYYIDKDGKKVYVDVKMHMGNILIKDMPKDTVVIMNYVYKGSKTNGGSETIFPGGGTKSYQNIDRRARKSRRSGGFGQSRRVILCN